MLGPFAVDPSITISELFDDNIFSTRNNEVSDLITIISPSLGLTAKGSDYALSFDAGADIARYAERGAEDYEDYWFGTDGRFDLMSNLTVFGGLRYSFEHEGRESPDDVNGEEPTTYSDLQSYFGTSARFDDVTLRLGGTVERLDFDDVAAGGFTINNDDRDRTLYELGGRVGYVVAPGIEPFAQGNADFRRYSSTRDDLGFDRDSEGFAVAGGIKLSLIRSLKAEAFVGGLHQDYQDGRLPAITAPDFGARLHARLSPRTEASAYLDRSVEETTLAGASAYLSTTAGGSIEHALLPGLTAEADFSYSQNDYEGVNRVDNVIFAGLGLTYFFLPNVFLGTEYQFLQRDSNISGEDYDENRLFIRLGAQLSPGYSEQTRDSAVGAWTASRGEGLLDGLYFGAQAGWGEVYTALDGPRGAGGNLTADFGDHGPTGGFFAGYGLEFNGWHLGLEGEAEKSGTKWEHARVPAGRVFSVEKQETYGGALRIAAELPSGNMIYGRGGVVLTGFDTDYVTGGGLNASDDNTVAGLRFGGGVEVPIYEGLFWRLDYSFTSYEDYDISFGNGVDNFSNSESLIRAGLGYRFGAHDSAAEEGEPVAHDFTGFYAGAQAGYGGISTGNEGPRQGNSRLTAYRGGHGGTGGGFGGYGLALGGLYLGAEAEAEAGFANWDIERDPTGRVYSVDKKWSYGGSARLGYMLAEKALLYGRAGAVNTRFNTAYNLGQNRVDQDDDLLGWRVGGGVEVAASEDLFVRFDYTYTGYDDYNVDYISGVDSFDHSESLFRVGLGYRF